MYPFPAFPHLGHAVHELIRALRRIPGDQHEVYCFLSPHGTRILSPFLRRYRIQAEILRRGAHEPGLHLRPIPILPMKALDRWISPLWQRFALARVGAEAHADLLHVHTCIDLALGAAIFRKRSGIPLVVTLRRELAVCAGQDWKIRTIVAGLRQADAVVAPSRHLARRCCALIGRSVEVIPSGTDPLFDEPPPGRPARNRRILYAGILDRNKGILALLGAARGLAARGVDFEVVVIGDGPLRDRARDLAQGLPVRFLGELPPLAVREQMRQSRLLCVPSYTETLGLVYLEAMKQGLPVIGRQGTGIDGMGQMGRDYELVRDDAGLAPLLARLLADPEHLDRLADNGRKLAAGWTWDESARRHRALYARLTGKGDAGASANAGTEANP